MSIPMESLDLLHKLIRSDPAAEQSLRNAYRDGHHLEGARVVNPYPVATALFVAWQAGWDHGVYDATLVSNVEDWDD